MVFWLRVDSIGFFCWPLIDVLELSYSNFLARQRCLLQPIVRGESWLGERRDILDWHLTENAAESQGVSWLVCTRSSTGKRLQVIELAKIWKVDTAIMCKCQEFGTANLAAVPGRVLSRLVECFSVQKHSTCQVQCFPVLIWFNRYYVMCKY